MADGRRRRWPRLTLAPAAAPSCPAAVLQAAAVLRRLCRGRLSCGMAAASWGGCAAMWRLSCIGAVVLWCGGCASVVWAAVLRLRRREGPHAGVPGRATGHTWRPVTHGQPRPPGTGPPTDTARPGLWRGDQAAPLHPYRQLRLYPYRQLRRGLNGSAAPSVVESVSSTVVIHVGAYRQARRAHVNNGCVGGRCGDSGPDQSRSCYTER